MGIKRGTELATIDVALVTIQADKSEDILALDTASEIAVTVNSETEDAVKLIIKGVLKAQKGEVTTITGNNIVLTDNVFTPELVVLLQGGEIEYDDDGSFKKYIPPVAGKKANSKPFTLTVYSAIYNAAAICVGYEKITYPNCQGQPVALSSQDGTFRVAEYTINSAPDTGEAPYTLEIVKDLPEIAEATSLTSQLSLDEE